MLEQGEFADYTESFPTPRVTQDALPYWAAVKEGRLLYQRCPACRGAIFPPRSICPMCEAGAVPQWEESQGAGSIYSFSVVHRPPSAVWRKRAPYTIGMVRLDEDWFLFTEIEGRPEDMAVDQRVQVAFPEREVALPVFRLVGEDTPR